MASAKDSNGKSNTDTSALGDMGEDGSAADSKSGETDIVDAQEIERPPGKEDTEEDEDREVQYSDIISPHFGAFVVVCFLIGGEL